MDYFDPSNTNGAAQGTDAAAATNGTAQPAANIEDAGMDEISVSPVITSITDEVS